MTPRKKSRDAWRRLENGTWTCSLGRRGQRVRLFQNCRDGNFYREVHVGGDRDRKSLGTSDRKEAERLATELLAALMLGKQGRKLDGPVRLGELAKRYLAESPKHRDNATRTKQDASSRIAILRAVLGDSRDVRTLNPNLLGDYAAARRAGGIRHGAGRVTGPVKQRSVQADVKLLKQMLRWACSVIDADGRRWLEQNPLEYFDVAGERDVRRPVADYERFEATRRAMQSFQARYASEAESSASQEARARALRRHRAWVRAEFGLVLLEATGRRRGAIMGLKWSDFDFETGRTAGRVTWRAEHDKKRRTSVVPYSAEFFEMVREFQKRLSAVGGYVFAREDDSTRPAAPELLSQRIRQAEEAAGLPKLEGGLCHPYRRKWRSERRGQDLKALMVAGGWADAETMTKCYDLPDDEAVLAVTSDPRKRREQLPAVMSGSE